MDEEYINMIESMNYELDLLEYMCDNNYYYKNKNKNTNTKYCKKCKIIFKAVKNYHNYCSLSCYTNK
jgi:hypothetical protein